MSFSNVRRGKQGESAGGASASPAKPLRGVGSLGPCFGGAGVLPKSLDPGPEPPPARRVRAAPTPGVRGWRQWRRPLLSDPEVCRRATRVVSARGGHRPCVVLPRTGRPAAVHLRPPGAGARKGPFGEPRRAGRGLGAAAAARGPRRVASRRPSGRSGGRCLLPAVR